MSIDDIHQFVYSRVLTRLIEIRREDGSGIEALATGVIPFETATAWQERTGDFAHNYQRNKFLRHRDKYAVVELPTQGGYGILVKVANKHATINRAVVQNIFGEDSEKALKVLRRVLRSVFSKVDVTERLTIEKADFSTNRMGNHGRICAV